MHGYAIAAAIRQRTDDAILVEEGALYPSLHRLAARGLDRPPSGDSRRTTGRPATTRSPVTAAASSGRRRSSGGGTSWPSPRSCNPPRRAEPWPLPPGLRRDLPPGHRPTRPGQPMSAPSSSSTSPPRSSSSWPRASLPRTPAPRRCVSSVRRRRSRPRCAAIDSAAVERTRRREWWGDIRQDVRLAFRTARRSPLFATVVAITFALGIGANAAVFSLLDAVLLRPLPFPEVDRLVRIYEKDAEPRIRPGDCRGFPRLAGAERDRLERLALFRYRQVPAHGNRRRHDARGRRGVARVLRDAPGASAAGPRLPRRRRRRRRAAGRHPELTAPGPPTSVPIPSSWGERCASATRRPPSSASSGRSSCRRWRPPAPSSRSGFTSDFEPDGPRSGPRAGGSTSAPAFGRLKPGVSLEQASREMETIGAPARQRSIPADNKGHTPRLVPLQDERHPERARDPLAGDGCGGAGPAHRLRQPGQPRLRPRAGPDPRVRGAIRARRRPRPHRAPGPRRTAGAGRLRPRHRRRSAATCDRRRVRAARRAGPAPRRPGAHRCARPALRGCSSPRSPRSRRASSPRSPRCGPTSTARSAPAGTAAPSRRRSHRLRAALVAAQVGLAAVLLVGCGLAIRSLSALLRQDLGFQTESVWSFTAPLTPAPLSRGRPRSWRSRTGSSNGCGAIPGVALRVRGVHGPDGQREHHGPHRRRSAGGPEAATGDRLQRGADTDYFRTLGIPARGRPTDAAERPDGRAPGHRGEPVAGRSLLPRRRGGQAGAHRDRSRTSPWLEIVGVVGDIRRRGVDLAPGARGVLPAHPGLCRARRCSWCG